MMSATGRARGREVERREPRGVPRGKANIAAPATMSHTSLPSQSGPMALTTTRRSVSSRPTSRCGRRRRSRSPRDEKPVRRPPRRRTRYTICRSMSAPRYVGSGTRTRGASSSTGSSGSGPPCTCRSMSRATIPTTAYSRKNTTRLTGTRPRSPASTGRPGQHEALDDPGLAPGLGEHPARRRCRTGSAARPRGAVGRGKSSSRRRHSSRTPHSATSIEMPPR